MQRFQKGQKEFGAELTNVVQKDAYQEMSKKVESEQEKMKEINRIQQELQKTSEAK